MINTIYLNDFSDNNDYFDSDDSEMDSDDNEYLFEHSIEKSEILKYEPSIIDINNDVMNNAVKLERTYNTNIQISHKIWLNNCLEIQEKCLNFNLYFEQYRILIYNNINDWIIKCCNSSMEMWNRSKKSKFYNDVYSKDISKICDRYMHILNLNMHDCIFDWLIKETSTKIKSCNYNLDNYKINICHDIERWNFEWKKIRKRYHLRHFQCMSQSFLNFYKYCPLCNEKLELIKVKCQNIKCNILEVYFPILKKQWYTFRCLNKSGYKMFSSVIPNPFVNNDDETHNFIYKSIQDMDIFIIALAGNNFNL